MQTEFAIGILIGAGLMGAILLLRLKARTAATPPAHPGAAPSSIDPIAAQQASLGRIAMDSSNRDFILEGEPLEIVEALEASMTVTLALMVVHGYRRDPVYFVQQREVMKNLLGRDYDTREAEIAQEVWDLKVDGMEIGPFVDEDLIAKAETWSAAKKEQILLGVLMARTFLSPNANDDWHAQCQREIEELAEWIANGFFGEMGPEKMESLQREALTRAETVRAAIADSKTVES